MAPETLFLELARAINESGAPPPAAPDAPEAGLASAEEEDSGVTGAPIMTEGTLAPPASAEHPAVVEAMGRLRAALAASPVGIDAEFVLRAADFALRANAPGPVDHQRVAGAARVLRVPLEHLVRS